MLGFSRGTAESAHIALDHAEIPKTVYHERLHQLSKPGVEQELGRALDEGITEDLAVESLGTNGHRPMNECYPHERAIAHQIRERCGDTAVEHAYFQGDTGELRRCLDRTLGAPGLERLQALLDDQLA